MSMIRRKKEDRPRMGRRNFLRTAAFLGPAAAALFAGQSRVAAETPEKASAPEGTRYRLTEHIRKYYTTL